MRIVAQSSSVSSFVSARRRVSSSLPMSISMIVGFVGMMIPATAAGENRHAPRKTAEGTRWRASADPDVRFARNHHSTGSGKTPRSVRRDFRRRGRRRMVASGRRANRTPHRRRLRGLRVARREKHLHLMGRQRLRRRVLRGRPPAELPAGKALVAKPKALPIIDQVSSAPSLTDCETRRPSR